MYQYTIVMGDLGHKIKLIDLQFKNRMDKNLEQLGLTTAQMNVLFYLEHHYGEKITQKKLSEVFNVKHSTMAGIMQRMVEKGLISITPDQQNKKFKNITLTEKSQEVHESAWAFKNYTEAVITKGFSEDEKKDFERMLQMVFHNLLEDSSMTQEDKDIIERRFNQK